MFCVRLMQLQHESNRDPCELNIEKLLETRISEAVELRKSLGVPLANTSAYRLVNSEGDRLSGLIVDVFGEIAVVASSAAWLEKYRTEVETFLRSIDGINHINWRPSLDVLKEDGFDISSLKQTESSTLCHWRRIKSTRKELVFDDYHQFDGDDDGDDEDLAVWFDVM